MRESVTRQEIEENDRLLKNLGQLLEDAERMSSRITNYKLDIDIIDLFLEFLQKLYTKRDNLLKLQRKLIKLKVN